MSSTTPDLEARVRECQRQADRLSSLIRDLLEEVTGKPVDEDADHTLIRLPISQRLRRLRGQRNLTQEALANRSGVSINAIIKIENEIVTYPRTQTVHKLAEALEVPYEWLT